MLPHEVRRRCQEKFGLGANPLARRRLYELLERLCTVHGERACMVVAECIVQAGDKRSPAQWFAFSVTRRLREMGMGAEAKPVSMDDLITGAELERRQRAEVEASHTPQQPRRPNTARNQPTTQNGPVRMFQPPEREPGCEG